MSELENNELPQEEGSKDCVEDGKNKLIVKCKFCGSKILDKQTAEYVTQEVLSNHLFRLYNLILYKR